MLPLAIQQHTQHIKPLSDRFFHNILESSPTPRSYNFFLFFSPFLAPDKLQGGGTNIKAWPLYTAYLLGASLYVGISCHIIMVHSGDPKTIQFFAFPGCATHVRPRLAQHWVGAHIHHELRVMRVRARRASSAVMGLTGW